MNSPKLAVVPKKDFDYSTQVELPKEFKLEEETAKTQEFSYVGTENTAFVIPAFQKAAYAAGAKSAGYNAGTNRYILTYDYIYGRD